MVLLASMYLYGYLHCLDFDGASRHFRTLRFVLVSKFCIDTIRVAYVMQCRLLWLAKIMKSYSIHTSSIFDLHLTLLVVPVIFAMSFRTFSFHQAVSSETGTCRS